MPDDVVEDLFAALDCHRDRALFSMFLSSGARAAELLGMSVADARPGQGRIYVRSKGFKGTKQACPASPEAFAWLALYLGELAQTEGLHPRPDEPLWWTRRHPLRPLTYTALRAVLNRINDRIGANITVHDLRHTLCLRLIAVSRLRPNRSHSPTAVHPAVDDCGGRGRPRPDPRGHGRRKGQGTPPRQEALFPAPMA